MSSLTKLDAFYSSFSDPAAVYTYPSVLNVTIGTTRVISHQAVDGTVGVSIGIVRTGNIPVQVESNIDWFEPIVADDQFLTNLYTHGPEINEDNSSLAAYISVNNPYEFVPLSDMDDTQGTTLRIADTFIFADFNEQQLEPRVFSLTNHSFRITGD
jgi:hypothetical protein